MFRFIAKLLNPNSSSEGKQLGEKTLMYRSETSILRDILKLSKIEEPFALRDYYTYEQALLQIEKFLKSKDESFGEVIYLPGGSGIYRVCLSRKEDDETNILVKHVDSRADGVPETFSIQVCF